MPENDGRHHDNSITVLKEWESSEGRERAGKIETEGQTREREIREHVGKEWEQGRKDEKKHVGEESEEETTREKEEDERDRRD